MCGPKVHKLSLDTSVDMSESWCMGQRQLAAYHRDDESKDPGLDHGGDDVPGCHSAHARVQDDPVFHIVHKLCDHHAERNACTAKSSPLR